MPTYELALILKTLQRPELSQVVKRCCTHILDKGGLIRGMENLGLKPLPYRMKTNSGHAYEGNYILVRFDGNTELPTHIKDELKRDTDVIRRNIFLEQEFVPPCLTGPCHFGEIKNPDHEKSIWWSRVRRRFVRWERKKAAKKS